MSKLGSIARWLEVQDNRNKLYKLAVVALPVLIGAGLLTNGQVQAVLNVLAILAGASVPGLAARHSRKNLTK